MEIKRREYRFPETLRKLMKKHPATGKATTQKELAGYLGIRPQSLSLHIKGRTMPTPDKILAMADFFGVSADFLLIGYEDKNLYSAMMQAQQRRLDESLGRVAELCSQAEHLALDLIQSVKPED